MASASLAAHTSLTDVNDIESLHASQQKLARMTFAEAAPRWLDVHSRYIASRTIKDYQQYIKSLSAFFGEIKLNEMNVGHFREYQRIRMICSSRLNSELSCLQQILKEADLWKRISPFYSPLPVSKRGAGKALTEAEEDELLAVAFSRHSGSKVAAHCLQLMLRTGCGFGEIQGLRRCDIDLANQKINILHGAKNENRRRSIPLSPKGFESLKWLLDRWERIGGRLPEDFLLPHNGDKTHSGPDFSRPMSGARKGWEGIRLQWASQATTDAEYLRRISFRLYDCRVTAITNTLASGKVSIHTAKRLFGHVSEAMQKRYYKPDLDTMRDAINLLDRQPSAETTPAQAPPAPPTPVIVIAPKSKPPQPFREHFRHRHSWRGYGE